MKLLDTNVFIYARGRPHPYQAACRKVLGQVVEEPTGYAIDSELLQEVLHSYRNRGELAAGFTLFDDIDELFPEPLAIGGAELREARRLMARYAGLSTRDAIHAAVVVTQGLEGLISADKAFLEVREIQVFDPRNLAKA